MQTVAEFKIQYRQILKPDGEAAEPLPEFARDRAEVLRMYRLMTLVRAFDAKAVNLQRTGQLGTFASCLGHEATHVGVGAAMHGPGRSWRIPWGPSWPVRWSSQMPFRRAMCHRSF